MAALPAEERALGFPKNILGNHAERWVIQQGKPPPRRCPRYQLANARILAIPCVHAMKMESDEDWCNHSVSLVTEIKKKGKIGGVQKAPIKIGMRHEVRRWWPLTMKK